MNAPILVYENLTIYDDTGRKEQPSLVKFYCDRSALIATKYVLDSLINNQSLTLVLPLDESDREEVRFGWYHYNERRYFFSIRIRNYKPEEIEYVVSVNEQIV